MRMPFFVILCSRSIHSPKQGVVVAVIVYAKICPKVRRHNVRPEGILKLSFYKVI